MVVPRCLSLNYTNSTTALQRWTKSFAFCFVFLWVRGILESGWQTRITAVKIKAPQFHAVILSLEYFAYNHRACLSILFKCECRIDAFDFVTNPCEDEHRLMWAHFHFSFAPKLIKKTAKFDSHLKHICYLLNSNLFSISDELEYFTPSMLY